MKDIVFLFQKLKESENVFIPTTEAFVMENKKVNLKISTSNHDFIIIQEVKEDFTNQDAKIYLEEARKINYETKQRKILKFSK